MENTQEVKAFEVGKVYTMNKYRDGIIEVHFKIVKRTAHFVTIQRTDIKQEAFRVKVSICNGRENINPYGYAYVFA